jgi:hypothetical protein
MNVIDIAGISFDEKRIELLQEWLIPSSDFDRAQISRDANALDRVQSFLIKNWDSLSTNEDSEVKKLLISFQYIKERMFSMAVIETGGEA